MKDIFFSGSNDGSGEVMGRNARRMMANLSISADEDLQQTLAFLEKVNVFYQSRLQCIAVLNSTMLLRLGYVQQTSL